MFVQPRPLIAVLLVLQSVSAMPAAAQTTALGIPDRSVTAGQLGPVPPRDQAQPPATGTARIRGRVTAADTGRPLRRAVVRLSAPGVREARAATTDADGQYEFTELPAGQYTLFASRSGYVQAGYKQSRPNTPARPVPLTDRQTAERIDIALMPGGVITGRVLDEYGEPVSDVQISAQRLQFINGARRPVGSAPPAMTNDIGEFRLYGLAPGEYYVSAITRAIGNPFETNSDRTGYAPTYYPSAPDLGSAQRVIIRGGDLVANIVVTLVPARVARVSGIALDAEGRPVRGGGVMASTGDVPGPPTANAPLRPDGTFVFNALPPGDYTLRMFANGPAGPNQMPMVSTARIVVNGTDLTNVVLQPVSQVTVSGRLTGDPALLAQIRPATARVIATAAGPAMLPGPPGPPPAVRDDLSFEVSAYPGPVVLRLTGVTGAVVKTVRANGRDVTRGFDLQPGAGLSDVELELAPATAKIIVTAANARSEPVPDRDIVIFTDDESQWGFALAGHGSVGLTDEQGRYQSPPLLSGSYYVADSGPLGIGEANDPDVLADLRTRAQRITVTDGETVNVQVRVSER